ncbi:hypothetical protein P148_SR1C00001G0329 [candidate division SR1 bacterium RAAC1_SR1_1]|nr:hypothetical protein P148_SR1C00001G0329 [candidate division SR1 bacterium RAAC1_SR1_1]
MKQHFQNIHYHVKKAHEHIKKHTKKAHEHLKRHGKWYIYGHILAASAILSIFLNSNSKSDASFDNTLCTQDFSSMNMTLEYDYTEAKKNVMLKGISFDKIIFPELILVNKVKQIKPVPNKNELSTDRGDLASYINPNKEDPTEEEIADYLSNNNLNNLIDGEGRGEVILDVELEKIVYDNTKKGDVIGELLIFERGMNADMYIQSVDSLGGKELGKKIFLNRKDLIYAGFDVDTVEIGTPQKMGYWKVDLEKLGVGAIKFLRISSEPKNSGPDFKIIGLNTKKCKQKQLEPLEVTALCSVSPENTRFWKITNPNDEKVEFTRDIYRSTQGGINSMEAKTDIMIQASPTEISTVLRVYLNGILQDIIPSSEEKCPIIQPEIPLELEPICSSDPESHRVWKVKNNNAQQVEFKWNIPQTTSCKGNKILLCHVPPGNPTNEHEICIAKPAVAAHLAKGSYEGLCQNSINQSNIIVGGETSVVFTTPVIDNPEMLSISIDNIEQDASLSTTDLCPKQPVNDYTISVTTDKQEIFPGEELVYTIQYDNIGPELMQSGTIELGFDENFEYMPNENSEIIISNNKIILPTMLGNSSNKIEIKGKMKVNINTDSESLFKAIISADRDINKDNNIVTTTTKIKNLEPLELSSLCSDNPSAVRAWRIQNPNPIDVPVDIYVQDEFSASVIAKANEHTYVKTNTFSTVDGINIVSLRYNGQKQIENSSENVSCPKPISDLAVENVNVEMVSEDMFVAQITFANLGPNLSSDILIDVAVSDAMFVVENSIQPELQETLNVMEIDETYILSITGALISGEAQIAVTINGQTIDPNVYNNNSQSTISSSNYVVPEEPINEEENQEHDAPTEEPENIQGYELGEQVDLDQQIKEDEYTEDMIGLGCHYTDEEYEKIKFQDVINHRSKPYVELLRINCIVKGREVNTFVTDDYIKRGEAIKVAIKLWGIDNDWKVKSDKYIYLGDTPMADVNNAHWSAQYVDKAYQIGLLDSLYKETISKKIFPNQNITRGESVELLVKTYLLLEKTSLEESEILIEAIFEDVDDKSSYAPYIKYAYEKGFLQGVLESGKTKFLPNQSISRSEFAKIAALIFKDYLPVFLIK